ncbi:MAG TPA: enoyl-CoA hydratase/isomerase family protein [Streptosporangiaceae bacterium]
MPDAAYVDRDKTIATVFLNRPERLNALDLTMATLLVRHFQELVRDDTISAIVVTGSGRVSAPTGIWGGPPPTQAGRRAGCTSWPVISIRWCLRSTEPANP